jgi:hypothetical protein
VNELISLSVLSLSTYATNIFIMRIPKDSPVRDTISGRPRHSYC